MDLNDYALAAQEIEAVHPGCRVYFDEDIDTMEIKYLIEIGDRLIRYWCPISEVTTCRDLYNKLEELIQNDE